ncbi:MAG: glycosyltransferase family 2 protein [Deltaproteobacteria bacterium]|nr:glycosyltransferase family 2 protein [Deltaproteobacteria bacterium]
MVKIDVIIVNYNSTQHLLRCLRSLYKYMGSQLATVLVYDNASIESIDIVETRFPKALVTRNARNIGFAAAVNLGLKRCRSPYIMLLNPDTYILDTGLQSAIRVLESRPDIGILGPQILDSNGQIQGSARTFPNFLTGFFGRTSIISCLLPQNRFTKRDIVTWKGTHTDTVDVDWVSGACMIVRRNAIIDVGHLDDRFFMYWEDADWCRRMREKKWGVIYYTKAQVVHLIGKSSEHRLFKSSIAFHKSAYRLFSKYATGPANYLKPIVLFCLTSRFFIHILSRYISQHRS